MQGILGKNFLLLFQGQLISQIGTQVFTLAALYWVMDTTHSSFYMGLFMLASFLPWVLLAPIGGALGDIRSKKQILVICDLIAGLAMLAAAAVFFSDVSDNTKLWCLMGAAVIASAANAFFQPSVLALVPEIVLPDQRPQANALIQGTEQGAKTLGFAAGGVAYLVIGAPLLFFINGVSFILSAASESLIKSQDPVIDKKLSVKALTEEIQSGFAYVRDDKQLRAFFIMVLLFNFLYAPFMVLLPLFIERLSFGAADYGILMASYTCGQLLAFSLSFNAKFRARPKLGMELALLTCPLALLAVAQVEDFYQMTAILLVQGVSIGVINLLLVTLLQNATPASNRAKVFGILKLFAGLALPFGMLIAGVVANNNSETVRQIFVISGLLILVIALAFRMFNKDYQAFLKQAQH